jgi:hypothetical protein
MVDIAITLTLPDDLAREAQNRGLLTAESLQRLLDAEIERRRKIDRLFKTMEDLAATNLPELTSDEMNAEIAAARLERQNRRARRP